MDVDVMKFVCSSDVDGLFDEGDGLIESFAWISDVWFPGIVNSGPEVETGLDFVFFEIFEERSV